MLPAHLLNLRFGIIQNNIALKHTTSLLAVSPSFGIIQNNIALKHSQDISST